MRFRVLKDEQVSPCQKDSHSRMLNLLTVHFAWLRVSRLYRGAAKANLSYDGRRCRRCRRHCFYWHHPGLALIG